MQVRTEVKIGRKGGGNGRDARLAESDRSTRQRSQTHLLGRQTQQWMIGKETALYKRVLRYTENKFKTF